MTPPPDSRRLWGLLAFVLTACGGGPLPIRVGASCTSAQGVAVQVEAGASRTCVEAAVDVDWFHAIYAERWPQVSLDGWMVRVVTQPIGEHFGMTYPEERTIDIQQDAFVELPHEFRHVALGPSHDGWCGDFSDWEKTRLAFNEDGYLGCR